MVGLCLTARWIGGGGTGTHESCYIAEDCTVFDEVYGPGVGGAECSVFLVYLYPSWLGACGVFEGCTSDGTVAIAHAGVDGISTAGECHFGVRKSCGGREMLFVIGGGDVCGDCDEYGDYDGGNQCGRHLEVWVNEFICY